MHFIDLSDRPKLREKCPNTEFFLILIFPYFYTFYVVQQWNVKISCVESLVKYLKSFWILIWNWDAFWSKNTGCLPWRCISNLRSQLVGSMSLNLCTFVVVKMSNRDSTTRCGLIALTQLHVNSINAKVAII